MNELDVLEYECGLDEKKDDLNVFESFYTELNYAKNDVSEKQFYMLHQLGLK